MTDTTTNPHDPRLGHGVDEEPGEQNEAYLVLSEEERDKGFVRPIRLSYIHDACGTLTSMGQGIAESFARDPRFYGSTFCCHCRTHRPVGEFKWGDGQVVGS